MSLFNNIQKSLKSSGFGGMLGDALGSAVTDAVGDVFNNPLVSNVAQIAESYIPSSITNAVNKYTGLLDTAGGMLDSIQNGNFIDAIGAGFKIADAFGIGGGSGNAAYLNTATSMFGGISPQDALEMYNKQRGNSWCRKNLWMLQVESALDGNQSENFNMFAYNIDFSPVTISGEKKQIGAAHVDLVNSADPVELTLTTLDNSAGFIKTWFEKHGSACASADGTVGLPSQYAIKITVIHGVIKGNGYKSVGKYRTGNMSLSLSRSEQALSEITMSFVQLDTFMS